MNEQQLAAVKQALEVLETSQAAMWGDQIDKAEKAMIDLQSIIAQHALDKKAENARELGLSYDDEPKIGCVNHDCDKCRAQPIDNGPDYEDGPDEEGFNGPRPWNSFAQPVPVKTYHDGKPWPVAPMPWVGLTDEEVMQTMSGDWTSQFYFARAIEAKLREKNT
jgi:hypothetical protein